VLKKIFYLFIIFLIGMGGGIFAEEIFWPYFVERPLFYQYRLDKNPIVVKETQKIVIQENTALKEAIQKVDKVVIGVQTLTSEGKLLEGSALILTNDGLALTLAELVPLNSKARFFSQEGELEFQILKRDPKENLILLKIKGTGFSTAGFGDLEKLKIGERVFLLGVVFEQGRTIKIKKIVNEGIIKTFNENLIQTNIKENFKVKGSPLFDIEGKVLGINLINKEGQVEAIPITKIRSFTGI
jgi:S1-C subfamily serine protease